MLEKIRYKFNSCFGYERLLIKRVRPFTLNSQVTLRNLRRLGMLVNNTNIEGDFVECGTYKGGSAAILASVLTSKRHLWLYDSFQGMPSVTSVDGEEAKEWVGKCVATENDVRQVLNIVGLPQMFYTLRKGWFEQSFKEPLPKKVALLHCDVDWYDSVMLVLETFYPLVSLGGCVILDDFGCWEGCREAFYDFCLKHKEKPLLERLEYNQAYWIKGRTNNRK